MKPTLYLETTIPSYLAARTSKDIVTAGNQILTHEFYESERHKYELYVSNYVLQECSRGDASAAQRRLSWLAGIELLKITPEVEPLADIYLHMLSIPQKSRVDALHLAICCINDIDILLSWNCSHLGVDNMLIVKEYNDAHGLSTPKMITPYYLVSKNKEVELDE